MSHFSDSDSERAILRLLVERQWSALRLIERAEAVLRPEDFSLPLHREVFRAALDLHHDGQPVDLLSIQDRLGEECLKSFGTGTVQSGMARLTELLALGDEASAPSLLPYVCEKVRSLSRARCAAEAAAQLRADIEAGRPVDESLAAHEKRLEAARETRADGIVTFAELAAGMQEHFEARLKGRECIPLGFPKLDAHLRTGPGHLITAGAYTNIGKSGFACSVISHLVRNGISCGCISLEMELEQIGERLVALLGHFSVNDWQPGAYVRDSDQRKLREGIELLSREDCFLRAPRSFSLPGVREGVGKMSRAGAKLVVVDYLQLIQTDYQAASRREEVLEVTRALKLLARKYAVCILVLAQCSREAAKAEAPQIYHLQESSSIEQDSDAVILLSRPEMDSDANTPIERAVINLAKNRYGRRGHFSVGFDNRSGVFVELTNAQQEGAA